MGLRETTEHRATPGARKENPEPRAAELTDNGTGPSHNDEDRSDDRFLKGMVLGSLTVTILNFVLDLGLPNIVVSVMLAVAIASLVYRWLGGIDPESRLVMGPVRTGGSIAALVGSAMLLNAQLPPQITIDQLFTPHHATWLALDRATGAPIKVGISNMDESLDPPAISPFRNVQLAIDPNGYIVPETHPGFQIGALNHLDLSQLGHVHSFDSTLDDFVVTPRLPARSQTQSLSPLPLALMTEDFGNEHSQYVVVGPHGAEHRGAIRRRGADIMAVGGHFYIVAVVEVTHDAKDPSDNYAKFAVGRLDLQSELDFH